MLTTEQARDIIGTTAVDADGSKIGKVGQVYLDDQTGQPEWVSVNTGLFGTSESLAPLQGASTTGDGVRLAYTKEQVKNAPSVDADQHLSPEEEQRLYRHYGLEYGTGSDAGYETDTMTTGTGTGTVGTDAMATDTTATMGTGTMGTGTDTTARTGTGTTGTDDAMTLSEERLRVDKERREVGRARLRKYVVTENETITVPVTKEKVRLEREPIDASNVDDALAGPDLSDAEAEIVLTEERVTVTKETVPVERVRLATETVTEDQTVTETVRKEQIEADGVGMDTDRTNDRI